VAVALKPTNLTAVGGTAFCFGTHTDVLSPLDGVLDAIYRAEALLIAALLENLDQTVLRLLALGAVCILTCWAL
jgi:hypothetical protein